MPQQPSRWVQSPFAEFIHQWPLPVRFARAEDELTSSWIIRLADAHGQSVQALGHHLIGRGRVVFGDDLDRGAWDSLLSRLSSAAEQPLADLYQGTLRAYEGLIWGHLPKQGPARWVLPIVRVGTQRTGYGLQYCPVCLATDERPYLRLRWRLAFVAWCPQHGTLLLDRCPACLAPIAPHRLRTGRRVLIGESGITRCHMCGTDRRSAARTGNKFSLQTATGRDAEDSMRMQQFMLNVLEQGAFAFDGRTHHALSFFAGMSALWSMLDDNRSRARLWEALDESDPGNKQGVGLRYGSFEKSMPSERARLLCGSWRLMAAGSQAMIDCLQRADISSGQVLAHCGRGRAAAPFWLWEPVHTRLNRAMYVPSDEEINQAIDFEVSRQPAGYARVADVCRLLNLKTSCSDRVRRIMREKHVIKRAFRARPKALGKDRSS